MQSREPRSSFRCAICSLVVLYFTSAYSMSLFNVRYVDNNGASLIATSNYNYALAGPMLTEKNWRTVSVNGDTIAVVFKDGRRIEYGRSDPEAPDLALLASMRDEIAAVTAGVSSVSSTYSGGGGGFMMSSSSDSSSFSSSSSSMGSNNLGISVEARDDNHMSVTKSYLPFNWSRVFFIFDLIAVVSQDGFVDMRPKGLFAPEQETELNKLFEEARQFKPYNINGVMQNSMGMISNIFNNIMGSLPRPPNYQQAVTPLFGNNFPFGSQNSPFGAGASWPFGGGGAFAFAGRRR